jgi:hypothetical protein
VIKSSSRHTQPFGLSLSKPVLSFVEGGEQAIIEHRRRVLLFMLRQARPEQGRRAQHERWGCFGAHD